MKRVLCQILCGWVMVFFIAANDAAMAEPQAAAPDAAGSLCLDSMETVPIADDLEPTEIAVDGGCMLSESVISI